MYGTLEERTTRQAQMEKMAARIEERLTPERKSPGSAEKPQLQSKDGEEKRDLPLSFSEAKEGYAAAKRAIGDINEQVDR